MCDVDIQIVIRHQTNMQLILCTGTAARKFQLEVPWFDQRFPVRILDIEVIHVGRKDNIHRELINVSLC